MIDHDEHGEKDEPNPEAPTDKLLLDRQQRLDRGITKFPSDVGFRHDRFFLSVFSWPTAA
jgi:hypothetical protein